MNLFWRRALTTLLAAAALFAAAQFLLRDNSVRGDFCFNSILRPGADCGQAAEREPGTCSNDIGEAVPCEVVGMPVREASLRSLNTSSQARWRRLIEHPIFWTLSSGLWRAIDHSKSIAIGELESLDFKFAGAPEFDTNREFEVFNPKSPRVLLPNFRLREHTFDLYTTVPGSSLSFNFRRERHGEGYVTDRIVAVIPNIRRQLCDDMAWPVQTPPQLEIPPNNHSRVEEHLRWSHGFVCAQNDEEMLFLLISLYEKKYVEKTGVEEQPDVSGGKKQP